MDEQKNVEISEEEVESSESSRREFVSRLITTAGAVALTGLLAGSGSESAEVQNTTEMHKVEAHKDWQMGKFRSVKLRNGFRVSMSGKELGGALRQAGLLAEGANMDNATLTIEFTV